MMTDRDSTTRTRARTPGEEDYPPSTAVHWRVTDPTLSGIFGDTTAMHEGRRQTNTGPAHAGSRLKLSDALGRRRPKCHPSSRTGENPPYGMIGGSRRRRHHSKPGPRLDPTRLRGVSSNGHPYRDPRPHSVIASSRSPSLGDCKADLRRHRPWLPTRSTEIGR